MRLLFEAKRVNKSSFHENIKFLKDDLIDQPIAMDPTLLSVTFKVLQGCRKAIFHGKQEMGREVED